MPIPESIVINEPIYQLSKIFKVSRPCIDDIREGLSWAWVK